VEIYLQKIIIIGKIRGSTEALLLLLMMMMMRRRRRRRRRRRKRRRRKKRYYIVTLACHDIFSNDLNSLSKTSTLILEVWIFLIVSSPFGSTYGSKCALLEVYCIWCVLQVVEGPVWRRRKKTCWFQ
jgi:hypothetical protein